MSDKGDLVGGKLTGDHYYIISVNKPINTLAVPYSAECADIIESLHMTFNEGEAFKALWRLAAARLGKGKPGNSSIYDADKVAHYGMRVAIQTKNQHCKEPFTHLENIHQQWVQMNLQDEAMEHQRE